MKNRKMMLVLAMGMFLIGMTGCMNKLSPAAPHEAKPAKQKKVPPVASPKSKPVKPKKVSAVAPVKNKPVKPKKLSPVAPLKNTPVNMKFVYVAPGSFQMGSGIGFKDEEPVHKETISLGFWIGKYEVTQKEYEAVMGNNPSHFKGGNRPVERASWNDAVEFCKKLTKREHKAGRLPKDCEYRLPTEAEWEFAARGGVKSKGYKFSGSNDATKVACYHHKKSGDGTEAVGSKDANELGIHDMSGNVYEWCSDPYDNYKAVRINMPAGITDGASRVVRGGGWCVPARYCRSTYRYKHSPDSKLKRVGFRIVRAQL